MDPDKAFAVQMALEESVLAGTTAYIQCALLYTSSGGERRIRLVLSTLSAVLSPLHSAMNLEPSALRPHRFWIRIPLSIQCLRQPHLQLRRMVHHDPREAFDPPAARI